MINLLKDTTKSNILVAILPIGCKCLHPGIHKNNLIVIHKIYTLIVQPNTRRSGRLFRRQVHCFKLIDLMNL